MGSDGSVMRRAPVDLLLLVLQNDAACADPDFAATPKKLAALKKSCMGDATPLAPQKRLREIKTTRRKTLDPRKRPWQTKTTRTKIGTSASHRAYQTARLAWRTKLSSRKPFCKLFRLKKIHFCE